MVLSEYEYSRWHLTPSSSEIVFLDVLLEERESVRGFSVVLDGAWRSSLGLSWDTVFIVFALSEPKSKILSGVNFDKWDLVLLGKSGNEFLVFWIITVLGEDAKVSIFSIQSLTDLVKTLNET
jgi:hypothetical protein